jgi:hypothetical protein
LCTITGVLGFIVQFRFKILGGVSIGLKEEVNMQLKELSKEPRVMRNRN